MTRFILPAANDAARLYGLAQEERRIDFMRGVVCGVSIAATLFSIIGLAALVY